MGDIVATLIAPNGASHTIFGVTGSTTMTGVGDSSDLGALYTFNNSGMATWWSVAATTGATVVMPTGTYRTSNTGGAGQTGAATDINAAFAGIPTSNGTWTLRFTDGCTGDTGNVTAANLTLTGPAIAVDAPNDTNGDGKSDFTVVRADGAPFAELMGVNDNGGRDKVAMQQQRADRGPSPEVGIGWWLAQSGGTYAPASPARVDHGQDTDFFMMEDFDNDDRDDLTVWSPGVATVAAYKILRSSNSTVQTIPYGQNGDDPTMIGDWNNDGTADVAVYRDGTSGSPQSFFFWSNVATPTVVNYIPWGTDGDIAYSLDYDGDGRNDPAVQRNGGSLRGDHWIRQSGNGATVFFIYGLSSDFVVPGDYDGDGRDDVCVSRNANFGTGTFKYFWVRESDGGGMPDAPIQWGIPGDFIQQGDFDGDGKTDVGVWRANVDPTMNFNYVRKSSDGGLLQYEWGASGDYPVNNWNVH
jgi:hypothetical protein